MKTTKVFQWNSRIWYAIAIKIPRINIKGKTHIKRSWLNICELKYMDMCCINIFTNGFLWGHVYPKMSSLLSN